MANTSMRYPIGIQSFEKLRDGGFAYVDKTQYVYQLAKDSGYYFLSRPRRFGKSLLTSTFEAYFLGKKDLFKGLAIEQLETEWTEYPVLYLDFNCSAYSSVDDLDERIGYFLRNWEELYQCPMEGSAEIRFENVIVNAHKKTGKQVVILVDEYDKPLLQAMNNKDLQDAYRNKLKSVYGNLKSQDKHIKFALITGVSKFSKVSIFSDLNNLNDISISTPFAGICGITESELHANFRASIQQMAEYNGVSYEEMSAQLKQRYDGYRFSAKPTEGVYNPFSLMNAFYYKELKDYWFETGTPTFLVEQLGSSDYDLSRLQKEELDDAELRVSDSIFQNPISLLFQTGYLTIKDYDAEFHTYRLGFPNMEVERGLLQCLLPHYVPQKTDSNFAFIKNFVLDVRAGRVEEFLQRLRTFFSDSDYRVAGKKEIYFQNAMYLIFRLMGFFTQVERATSKGRIDVTVQTADYIYIIEVKLDGTAKEALQQIEEKGYAKPFAMDPRLLFKVGVNFSSKTRSVEEWLVVKV